MANSGQKLPQNSVTQRWSQPLAVGMLLLASLLPDTALALSDSPTFATSNLTTPLPSSPLRLARMLSGHTAVALSPNGQILASVGVGTTIDLWNLSNGKLIRRLSGHTLPILALAISPDGQTLASASHDKTVRT